MPDGGCDSIEQDKRVMEKMGVVSDSGQSSGSVSCPDCGKDMTEMGTTVIYWFCDHCGHYKPPNR